MAAGVSGNDSQRLQTPGNEEFETLTYPTGAGTSFGSVSVIVPVYNRVRLIEACLQHLQRAARPLADQGVQVEIVVADDASTDGSGQKVLTLAEKADDIVVRLVTLEHRQGPGRARNAALHVAQGELVVFVDSDIVVVPGFLEAHLAAYSEGGPVYTVGTVVAVPDLERALEYPSPTKWDLSNASLHTANASVPRAVLEQVGFFDSGFEGYGWEDLDLGRRLKKAGYKRVMVHEAIGYHVDPPLQTREQFLAQLDKERQRGRYAVHFMEKHPEFSARMTAQDTVLHRGLNWLFRLGGLVHEENVLDWVEWARRRRLTALEKMWIAGVLNQVYLESLGWAKKARSGY